MEAGIARENLIEAAISNVAFDGWSDATLRYAIAESGIEPGLAHALFPRGGIDLALGYHALGDRDMSRALATADLTALRFSARIAHAVMLRLTLAEREAVRRGTTLFALPQYAAEGAKAIWGTADAIWTALGDSSDDVNWYTKRATLSAVYAATVLFWLGDDSNNHQATRDFLERRIDGVMQFEKTKAAIRDNPLGKLLLAGPMRLLSQIRAPSLPQDLPGGSASEAAAAPVASAGRDIGPRPF